MTVRELMHILLEADYDLDLSIHTSQSGKGLDEEVDGIDIWSRDFYSAARKEAEG